MPAEKCPLSMTSENSREGYYNEGDEDNDVGSSEMMVEVEEEEEKVVVVPLPSCSEESRDFSGDDDDGGSPSSSVKEEYVQVKLADIRKEVQCPICLGIIKKTRTVMGCLHRFCRECIDKSMRLGNNECPACRTHCASRRSLRDDPNYDALIASLYPDIDKYEEEELAFQEEETNRNKQIQASIAETFRKQTEAVGKKRNTGRSKVRNLKRGRNGSFVQGSDEDKEDTYGNNGGKNISSGDEHCPDIRIKRFKSGPQHSPAMTRSIFYENINGASREVHCGNRELLVWGKGGARSQTRHVNGANGKNNKGSRVMKLVDYLHSLDEKENEFELHLNLLPLDKDTLPGLERPYICCRPTLSIGHICQFIALQTSTKAEEIEILVRKPKNTTSSPDNNGDPLTKGHDGLEDELQILEAKELLSGLHTFFSSSTGNLVLVYRAKNLRIKQHKGSFI